MKNTIYTNVRTLIGKRRRGGRNKSKDVYELLSIIIIKVGRGASTYFIDVLLEKSFSSELLWA